MQDAKQTARRTEKSRRQRLRRTLSFTFSSSSCCSPLPASPCRPPSKPLLVISHLPNGTRLHTLRFVPLPLPFSAGLSLFLGDAFGLAVKNPSRRPCCFAFRNFASFSAPFRTRSSLRNPSVSMMSAQKKISMSDVLESLLPDKEVDEPVDVRALPLELELIRRRDVWFQEDGLRLLPGPLLGDLDAAFLLLALLGRLFLLSSSIKGTVRLSEAYGASRERTFLSGVRGSFLVSHARE